MANWFTQLCYPQTNDENIEFFDKEDWSNNLIEGKKVIQLGIYALPGTTFLINQSDKIAQQGLVINGTGLFQMNMKDNPITSLKLNKNSYNNLKQAQHFAIIDLVYEGGL